MNASDRAKRNRKARIDKKVCLSCPMPVTKFRHCAACREERNRKNKRKVSWQRNHKEKYRDRAAKGECVRCGVKCGTYRCAKCAEDHRNTANKYYRNKCKDGPRAA